MNIKDGLITKGFILSGLMNIIGVLVFSQFFSNAVIPEYDTQAMSNFGLLMIVVWGCVFISVSKIYYKVKWLIGVFAIEKLIYATHWTNWMLNNTLSEVFAKDKMAGIYYAIYGINDWLFFVFFLIVFIQLIRTNK
ncbi:hypothetical protein [Flavobacterium psychrolimnae]|jgi:hypothetical protein|uniref:Uncharacterized protein n=1 Tax=Flavobacterium psychrolimnae TaxID=249351 RepID=A0A366B6T6_9FLAO|nr:hypothetical protein [Flavobacterium psychrolimnae]RBN51877.1 hypothetical protein DR980_01560 [Flavobacterium psychrolimnae]